MGGFLRADRLINRITDIIHKEDLDPVLSQKHIAPDWKALDEQVTQKHEVIEKQPVSINKMRYYHERKDYRNLMTVVPIYLQQFGTWILNDMEFGNYAREIFNNCSGQGVLTEAISWCERIRNSKDTDPFTKNWYSGIRACLLYKAGRNSEAIAAMEETAAHDLSETAFMERLAAMKRGEKIELTD